MITHIAAYPIGENLVASAPLGRSFFANSTRLLASSRSNELHPKPLKSHQSSRQQCGLAALVTGASSGLGKAIADLLEEKGYTVLRIEGRRQYDLAKREERAKLIELIHREVPDLVVNCAGFGLYGPAISLSTQEQIDVFEVNSTAVFEITVEAARAMKEASKGGVILNVSSAAAYFEFPHFSSYAASKACVTNFSQSLDFELRPHGICVLVANPGQVATPFRNRAAHGHPQKRTRQAMSCEAAARHLYRQIQNKKAVVTFDWRYRIALFIARLLPKSLLRKRLRASIDRRI